MLTVTQYTPSPFTDYTTLRLWPSEWRPSSRPNPTTWYIIRATARLTEALLNNPGLQGTPAARPPTVASPVAHDRRLAGQYPGTSNGDGASVLCTVACLLAVLTYGEALSDRIISYRDILCDIVSYRIVSLMAVSCHH